jgi:superfamily II DNA or RNA helicase
MSYALRPYQSDLVKSVYTHWGNGLKRVLLQCPTGGGKTVIFNHIADKAEKKGYRVLIICDRRELITQSWQKLWEAHGIHAGIILDGYQASYHLSVQIASIQTLTRRTFPPDINLVIIDECRSSTEPSYAPIFEQYKDAYFLGVDATPIRTSGKGFDGLYDAMVLGPTIKQMEEMGALVPARSFVNPINQEKLDKIGRVAGDYNEAQLAEFMSSEGATSDLILTAQKHAPGMKTICFAVNVMHSKTIVSRYLNAGISAVHVDGETDKEERKRIFSDFKKGKVEKLSNVGIATYGFDEPTIQVVQDAAPTLSLSRYLQKLGRGARLSNGKENYIHLDHANGIATHGMPNADRLWSLYGVKKGKKLPPKIKVEVDGIEHTVNTRDLPEEMQGITLEEVDEATILYWHSVKKINKIISTQRNTGKKPLWVYFEFVKKYPELCGIKELTYIRQQLGFKPGWERYKYAELNA